MSEVKTPPGSAEPEYLSQFCPILSHAMLRPVAEPTPSQTILTGMSTTGGAPVVKDTAFAEPEAKEAEYVGCQGPSCAFFLKNEGKCAITLIPMALGAILFRFGGMPQPDPTSQH